MCNLSCVLSDHFGCGIDKKLHVEMEKWKKGNCLWTVGNPFKEG